MDFFKEWIFCVCATLIISVVFSLFTPQGSMKDFYKIAISIFIFISFLYPFKNFDISDIQIDSSQQILDINNESNKSYESEINAQIKALLKKEGIVGANVSSKVRFDIEETELEIKEVVISIPDEYSKSSVEKLVFDELGINSEVVYIGG